MRHGTCFRRHLSAHHAGAAPHSAVAELGVVELSRYAEGREEETGSVCNFLTKSINTCAANSLSASCTLTPFPRFLPTKEYFQL